MIAEACRVDYTNIEERGEAILITSRGVKEFVPKSCAALTKKGLYVAEFILRNKKLKYSSSSRKTIDFENVELREKTTETIPRKVKFKEIKDVEELYR